jgi:hypothetical protein
MPIAKTGSANPVAALRGVVLILGAILLAAATWHFILVIWLAPGKLHFSDFYPSWYATREFFLHHRNPYGLDVARDVQTWIYGRPNDPASGRSMHDHQFVYPAYVCFLLWPAGQTGFETAQNAVLLVLAIATAASVWLWLQALNWRASPTTVAVVLVLVLGSLPAAQGLYLRQLGLFAAAFLAATAAAVAAGKLRLAGVLLALATIKPQLCLLAVVWLLIWCAGNWSQRKPLAGSFLAAMAILAGGTAIALPSWPREFWQAVQAYPEYNDGRSVLQLLLGRSAGQICALFVILAVLALAWKLRRVRPGSASFMLIFSLVLSSTLIVIPTMAPHGQVLLLPAALWLWRERSRVTQLGRAVRYTFAAMWALLAAQWLLALALTSGALISSTEAVRRFWVLPFSVSPLLPVIFTLALALPALLKLRAWAMGAS